MAVFFLFFASPSLLLSSHKSATEKGPEKAEIALRKYRARNRMSTTFIGRQPMLIHFFRTEDAPEGAPNAHIPRASRPRTHVNDMFAVTARRASPSRTRRCLATERARSPRVPRTPAPRRRSRDPFSRKKHEAVPFARVRPDTPSRRATDRDAFPAFPLTTGSRFAHRARRAFPRAPRAPRARGALGSPRVRASRVAMRARPRLGAGGGFETATRVKRV